MTIQTLSSKKYSTAVILSGIFGILGIHHFYCGRVLHGLFDLTLAIVGISLIYSEYTPAALFGMVLLAIDIIHSVVVTFLLLVGNYKDGEGNIIAYPGQKLK